MKTYLSFIVIFLFLQFHNLDSFGQAEDITTDSAQVNKGNVFYGIASYYSDKFDGRKTANGEIFDQNKFTAASNKFPLGTKIKVTNVKNGLSVVVRVNDRLHPKMNRIVDLSKAAAKKINILSRGIAKVKVEVLKKKGKD